MGGNVWDKDEGEADYPRCSGKGVEGWCFGEGTKVGAEKLSERVICAATTTLLVEMLLEILHSINHLIESGHLRCWLQG